MNIENYNGVCNDKAIASAIAMLYNYSNNATAPLFYHS